MSEGSLDKVFKGFIWLVTCTRAVFHYSACHGPQFEGLALFDRDEIDGDIGDWDYACHGCSALGKKVLK